MIKKLANKLTGLLLKFKKSKPSNVQDSVINSIIDSVVEDVQEIAKVADVAAEKVVKTAVEEGKKVVDEAKKKAPKPATKKVQKTAPAKGTQDTKGRPKKSAQSIANKVPLIFYIQGELFCFYITILKCLAVYFWDFYG